MITPGPFMLIRIRLPTLFFCNGAKISCYIEVSSLKSSLYLPDNIVNYDRIGLKSRGTVVFLSPARKYQSLEASGSELFSSLKKIKV